MIEELTSFEIKKIFGEGLKPSTYKILYDLIIQLSKDVGNVENAIKQLKKVVNDGEQLPIDLNDIYTKNQIDNLLRQYSKLVHNHSKSDITNLPKKVIDLDDGANYYTINQLNNKLNDYSKLNHSHTKAEITDFPTKLSEFENDLNFSSGSGTVTESGEKVAYIEDFGAINLSSISFNSSNNTYTGADSSKAIINAINSGFTKIVFPPNGKFICSSLIQIDKKVIIDGNNSIIYSNPINKSDRNIFYFKSGSKGSIIKNLNFESQKAFTVNLNTNVTAKSSNLCAIGVNNNAENIVIDNCSGKGLKYLVACSVCKNVTIKNCYGEDNYFTVYTGYNAYNTTISNCNFSEQKATDMYGHVLYLGGATYGVLVENCVFNAVGDDSSNIIKCGADQTEYCQDVIVKNTIMKCKSKASFLYCHAHANVEYYDCKMEFTCSDKTSYCRLLQFNNYSDMKFNNCTFILDSIQKFTHTDNNKTENTLIFDNCNFSIKNSVNTYLLFDLSASANDFKLRNCNFDYSKCTSPINMIKSALINLEILNCSFKLPSGSMFGFTSSGNVSYAQTTSPKLLMANTKIELPNGNTTTFFNYVKGSTSANINLINDILINGENSSNVYIKDTNDYNKVANLVNIKM